MTHDTLNEFRGPRRAARAAWWSLASLAVIAVALAAAWQWTMLPSLAHQTLTRLAAAIAPGKDSDCDHDHADGDHDAACGCGHDHAACDHDHAAQPAPAAKAAGDDHDADDHDHDADHAQESKREAGHDADHDHGAEEAAAPAGQIPHRHDEAASLKLSSAAQQSAGVRVVRLQPRSFERTITLPAMVTERPGRTTLRVAAPMAGRVTTIWPLQGETVSSGQPLFEMRLTHEELVDAQGDFLRAAEELDVVQAEISRLEIASRDGAIAGKSLLERKYEQQKIQAALRSHRQRLQLHGLTADQIDGILAKRQLLSEVTVRVPDCPLEHDHGGSSCVYQIESIRAERGEHVSAGDTLGVLVDYCELYIEGKAFEQDAKILDRIVKEDRRLTAVFEGQGSHREMIPDLKVMYQAGKIDPESRAFSFYVRLPNRIESERTVDNGHRFAQWMFKPGQRCQLLAPTERWENRLVLPLEAVVQDGAEYYVFEHVAGHFDRRTVHVEYRDAYWAVIANDGALPANSEVAISGAYQVHLALKNKSGGAPDPHAGHNH